MPKSVKPHYDKPTVGREKLAQLGHRSGLADTTGSWKESLDTPKKSDFKTLGRLVLASEDTVSSILELNLNVMLTTSGGLLVFDFLRGTPQLRQEILGNLLKRLATLDSANAEVKATGYEIVEDPVLNKWSKKSGAEILVVLDAPELAPEIERFNRIRLEIAQNPKLLYPMFNLARVGSLSMVHEVLEIIDATLPPDDLKLGPLAVLTLDSAT